MERTHIAQIFADQESFANQSVTVMGWARTIRDIRRSLPRTWGPL